MVAARIIYSPPPGAVNCTGVFLPVTVTPASPVTLISERVTEDGWTDGRMDNDKHMPVRSNHMPL